MASSDFLLQWLAAGAQLPAANYPQYTTRNGRLLLAFDAATAETALFHGVLPPNYSGGGLTAMITWTATSATSGAVVWGSAIERGTTDIDSDSFATQQTATTTCSGTSGIAVTTSITHTSGANMDSLAAGEPFWLQVQRVAANGSDTMTGDAEVWNVVVKET